MIDKSLSMEETGKFNSLHRWVRDQLISQMVIDGDRVMIYQFYGKTDKLLSVTVGSESDRTKIIETIDAIKPDGQYTDIGLAIDTMRTSMDSLGDDKRHKVMLLLTDLKQEAPDSSRYAGTADTYQSPYLAGARVLQHDEWYEITLDMDMKNRIDQTSKELYAAIQKGETGKDRDRIVREIADATDSGAAVSTAGTDAQDNSSSGGQNNSRTTADGQEGVNGTDPLPLPVIVVLSCVVVGAGLGAALAIRAVRNKKKEDEKTA
jgi:hypothetical protein